MSATAINICNSAILKLGGRVLLTLNDATKEGDLCRERYPRLRDKMLRDHIWSFSKKATVIDSDGASDLAPEWNYVHSMPPDLARIISLEDGHGNGLMYETVQTEIHTNHTPITLRYVMNFTDLDDGMDWPDDFAEALAFMLASDIAVSLTQDNGRQENNFKMGLDCLATARFNGSIERTDEDMPPEDWLEAHQGYCWNSDRSGRNFKQPIP